MEDTAGRRRIDGDLARLEELSRAEARHYAATARLLADLVGQTERAYGVDGVEAFLLLDVAGTCALGQQAAATRMAHAQRLTQTLTRTLEGLSAGEVRVGQALVLLYQTASCSDAVAAEVERRLYAGRADGLLGMCPADVRHAVDALVPEVEAELDPGHTRERLESARARRRVSVQPEPDGMASLWALLPAEQLREFALGLDELARRQKVTDRAEGVDRTADQRRADLLGMLPRLALHALDGLPAGTASGLAGAARPGGGAGVPRHEGGGERGTGVSAVAAHPSVQLVVHVPMATLLGVSQAPGHLESHGPLPAEQVRLMLPNARLRRLLVDEQTGRPVQADRTLHKPAGTQAAARELLEAMLSDEPVPVEDDTEPQYTPSEPLARFVRLRDRRCSGPGCSQTGSRSDLDHREPWPVGPTSSQNLRPTSRRCHRAKTISWSVHEHDDGRSTWTSPTGRRYTRQPAWAAPPVVPAGARLRPPPAGRGAPPGQPEERDHVQGRDLVHALEPPVTAPRAEHRPTREDLVGTINGWPGTAPF